MSLSLASVQSWNLMEIEAPAGTRDPVVVHSGNEARAVLIALNPGQVHGRPSGEGERVGHGPRRHACESRQRGDSFDAAPGMLFRFDPDERHSLASDEGARILLLLAPWPGEGHYRGSAA